MALLITVSTLASLLVSTGVFADPQKVPVDASQTLYQSMSPSDQAKTWLYYQAMDDCVINTDVTGSVAVWPGHSTTSEDGIKKGQWFNAGYVTPPIGYVVGAMGVGIDGWPKQNLGCDKNNTAWILDALKAFGYSDPLSAWCDMTNNLTRNDGNVCSDSASTDDWNKDKANAALKANFETAVQKKVFGGVRPNLTDAARFVINQEAFYGGCLGTATPSAYTGTETAATNNHIFEDVPTVDPNTGVIASPGTTYDGLKTTSDTISYAYKDIAIKNDIVTDSNDDTTSNSHESQDGWMTNTCGGIFSQMGAYSSAYSQVIIARINSGKQGDTPKPNPAADSATSCGVSGVGWIVCPVMTFLGDIGDKAFSFLAQNFLETPASMFTQGGSSGGDALYQAWGMMRNIANVGFVIAVLVIIFSQLTGLGISNYGVKKMLPRLMVAALLVNVSFYLCAIAVDISNILGYSLQGLFSGLGSSMSSPYGDAGNTGWGWATLVAGLIAGGVTLAFAISVPVILAALVAVLAIALTLAGRTAVIILLIVVSPLAFVAYLLPNTEQWFKKWLKMGWGLLMVFPAVGLLFGVGKFAGRVVYAAGAGTDNNLLAVMSIAVAVAPLFLVPGLLKAALKATGEMGAKIGNLNNRLHGSVTSQAKKGLGASKLGDLNRYRQQQSQIRRTKAVSGVDPRAGGGWNPANWRARANRGVNQLPGLSKYGAQSAAQGASLNDELFEKEVKEAAVLQGNQPVDEVAIIAASGKVPTAKTTINGKTLYHTRDATRAEQAAAVDRIMSSGSFAQRQAALVAAASGTDAGLKSRAVKGAYAKGDQNIYGAGFGDQIVKGNIRNEDNLRAEAVKNAASGALKPSHVVENDAATEWLAKQVNDPTVGGGKGTAAVEGFKAAARGARASDTTRKDIVENGKIDNAFKLHGV